MDLSTNCGFLAHKLDVDGLWLKPPLLWIFFLLPRLAIYNLTTSAAMLAALTKN